MLPRITSPPSITGATSVTGYQGGVVRLQCNTTGIPRPNIQWEKNRAPLPPHLIGTKYVHTTTPSGHRHEKIGRGHDLLVVFYRVTIGDLGAECLLV